MRWLQEKLKLIERYMYRQCHQLSYIATLSYRCCCGTKLHHSTHDFRVSGFLQMHGVENARLLTSSPPHYSNPPEQLRPGAWARSDLRYLNRDGCIRPFRKMTCEDQEHTSLSLHFRMHMDDLRRFYSSDRGLHLLLRLLRFKIPWSGKGIFWWDAIEYHTFRIDHRDWARLDDRSLLHTDSVNRRSKDRSFGSPWVQPCTLSVHRKVRNMLNGELVYHWIFIVLCIVIKRSTSIARRRIASTAYLAHIACKAVLFQCLQNE